MCSCNQHWWKYRNCVGIIIRNEKLWKMLQIIPMTYINAVDNNHVQETLKSFILSILNTAPAMGEILTESDAVFILEELTEAQNHAQLLGLVLNIMPAEVEAISKMYQDPKERLYHIILAFLRQVEPPPTWRAIVNALKSPVVNLTALAKRVEAAHFLDPTTYGESVYHIYSK